MTLALTVAGVVLVATAILFWRRREKQHNEMQEHSVTADALHALWTADRELLIFDVRQPLDLLAYPEIIPRARRIPPDDALQNPSLIPKDKEIVVYCTCPGDKTSRAVMQQARATQLCQVKFLVGGLAAWKAKGYPVEPYREVFHLYKSAASGSASLSS